ncbi:RING/U-box superfamily protein [Striga asiatica]|uniref:RING/U-box superfamily protein n=1 Tax=Striga asiatica TaxID=4170 RepID=A0A5A7PZK6_STRAF|nr:RING/U-box superfamily protein [Striga asiatica]
MIFLPTEALSRPFWPERSQNAKGRRGDEDASVDAEREPPKAYEVADELRKSNSLSIRERSSKYRLTRTTVQGVWWAYERGGKASAQINARVSIPLPPMRVEELGLNAAVEICCRTKFPVYDSASCSRQLVNQKSVLRVDVIEKASQSFLRKGHGRAVS